MTQIYTGNYGGGMDAGLLHKAMYEVVQPNGLLVFRDPARTTGTSVTFDPDGSGSKLESFPGQDIRGNNIINTAGYRDPGDTLRVTSNVSGDINPGYLRTARQLQAFVDDDFARWNTDWASTYINDAVSLYNVSTRGRTVSARSRCSSCSPIPTSRMNCAASCGWPIWMPQPWPVRRA